MAPKAPLLAFSKNGISQFRNTSRRYARYVVNRQDIGQRFPRSQPLTNVDDFYVAGPNQRQTKETALEYVKEGVAEAHPAPQRTLEEISEKWDKGKASGLFATEFDYEKPVKEFFGEEHAKTLTDWEHVPEALDMENGMSYGDRAYSFVGDMQFTSTQMKVMESVVDESDSLDAVKSLTKDDIPQLKLNKLREVTTPEEFKTVENYLMFVVEDVNHEFDLPKIADVVEKHWDNVKNKAVQYLDENLEQNLSIVEYTSFQSQQWMKDADGIRVDQRGTYAYFDKYYPEAVDRALVEAEIGVLNFKYRPELRFNRFTPTEAIEALHDHTIGVNTAEQEQDLENLVTMQADTDVGGKKIIELMLSVKKMGDITTKLNSEVSALKTRIEALTFGAEEEEDDDETGNEFRVDLRDRKFIMTDDEFWHIWGGYGVTKELRDNWHDPKYRWQYQKEKIVERKADPRPYYDRGVSYQEHREYRFFHMMTRPVEEQQELLKEFGVFKHFSK